jgi:heme o synthase
MTAPSALPATIMPAEWRDFLALTKPRVMSLAIFTALCGMLAAPVPIHPVLGFTAILAIALGAGASGALNQWYEARIDGLMKRTAARPLPAGRMDKQAALHFGVGLGVFSVLLLGVATNWVAAALLAVSILFYLLIYTIWLKPRTPQNIVIGGAAGAFPPLVGWAAVTGRIDLTAVYLFLIVFYWTPPHFWALALNKQKDYGNAKVPMAPLVWGERETMRQMFWYTVVLLVITLLPLTYGAFGWIYGVSAAVFGGLLLGGVVRMMRAKEWVKPAWWVYGYSLLYLALIFVAMVVDRQVLG